MNSVRTYKVFCFHLEAKKIALFWDRLVSVSFVSNCKCRCTVQIQLVTAAHCGDWRCVVISEMYYTEQYGAVRWEQIVVRGTKLHNILS